MAQATLFAKRGTGPCHHQEQKPGELENLRQAAMQILAHEIEFVPNRYFNTASAEQFILSGVVSELETSNMGGSSRFPRGLPAHLARLCEESLLSAELEKTLFRGMNYLKFRANAVRSTLDPDNPDQAAIVEFQRLLEQAMATRDRIIRANMRLVISVVKKFASPQFPFDDLLSEGIVSLMHAVEKFDFDRGFRFSTYAYRSIARNAYRKTMDRQRDNARFATGSDDSLLAAEDRNQWSSLDEHGWTQLRSLVKTFVGQLDRRERFIIRGRFALGSHQKIRTFQCLAEKLGVSKERVRQIEQRAISKMRVMAAEALKDEAIVPTI